MHVFTIVIGALLMFVGVGFVMASNQQLVELQFEVNQRLPKQEQFEPLGWTIFTRTRLRELQKELAATRKHLDIRWA